MDKVRGHEGVCLAIYDEGDREAPVLFFIHGFSQAALSWKQQRNSDLKKDFRILSVDMRGHGASDKPQFPEAYNNYLPFAEDIKAILDYVGATQVVPICWSMGGNWISDYMRKYGDEQLAGIVLVGATTQQGTNITEKFFGPGAIDNLEGLFDLDLEKNISATKAFVNACTEMKYCSTDFEDTVAFNMIVSPQIRQWMLGRISDNNDVLKKLKVPILQVHGTADNIVLPYAGEFTMKNINHKNKELKLYEGVGHSPFYECPERFNSDLRNFADKVFL